MAVDKSFVVKNGLEVNSDLIVADASTKKVGIASTAPRSTLDVRGGIAATDINITGIATIANLEVAAGDVNLTNVNVTGFSTLGGLSVDQLTVTGFTTFADISYDEITGRNLNLTGIATIPTLNGLTQFTDLNGTNATVGVATITTATVTKGTVTNLEGTNLSFSGISTVTTSNVTTANITTLAGYPNFTGGATVVGTVTAAHFSGGGLGVGVGTTAGVVGYGVTFFEFKGPGFTTAQYNAAVGIVTVNFQGGGGGSASIGVGSTPGDAFTGIITAGNLWYNSGLGRLFIYYQDDNSAQWVDAAPFNVGIITQLTSVAFSTGSVSAPALSFGNDSNTGFFAPADGSVAYSSNGAGIVTFNSTGVVATSYFGDGSNLTGIDATSLKDDGGNVKAQANPNGVVITGVATATSFEGDGSNLTNLPAGLGTALSSDNTSPLNKIYYTDQVLGVASTITIDPPSTAIVAYTQYAEVEVSGDADLIIGDGDEFIPNVLGVGTLGSTSSNTGGKVRADNYSNAAGTGAPTFGAGLNVTGVVTATSFNGAATGLTGTPNITVGSVSAASGDFSGNVTIGGTLTYQDVSHIDAVGIITAQQGIQVLANGLDITGVGTFKSNVSIADSILHTGDTDTAIRFPSADTFTVETGGSEKLRVASSGRLALSDSEGIKLSEKASTLYQEDGSISYYSSTNGVYVNGAGTLGFLRLQSAGTENGQNCIDIDGGGKTGSRIRLRTANTERLGITSTGGIHFNNGELIERVNVTSGKLSDNTDIDLADGMMHLFTTTETTTATPNIRISSTKTLNNEMATGDAISVTIVTTAAAAGYAATVNIDGATVGTNGGTLNWTGGSAPSDGGSSGVDIYAYTIMKTASATYTVIASQTKTS